MDEKKLPLWFEDFCYSFGSVFDCSNASECETILNSTFHVTPLNDLTAQYVFASHKYDYGCLLVSAQMNFVDEEMRDIILMLFVLNRANSFTGVKTLGSFVIKRFGVSVFRFVNTSVNNGQSGTIDVNEFRKQLDDLKQSKKLNMLHIVEVGLLSSLCVIGAFKLLC